MPCTKLILISSESVAVTESGHKPKSPETAASVPSLFQTSHSLCLDHPFLSLALRLSLSSLHTDPFITQMRLKTLSTLIGALALAAVSTARPELIISEDQRGLVFIGSFGFLAGGTLALDLQGLKV